MKKIIFYALMCLCLLTAGCEKIKEATSKDFKVNNVSFDFTAESKSETALRSAAGEIALRAAATQSFTLTRKVIIDELKDNDAITYASKIREVAVNASRINVTTVPANDYTVENLTITAVGVDDSIVVPSYTMGGAFTFTTDMNKFTSAFITKLLATRSILVTIKGYTDAPAGTTLNINYGCDLVLTASII